MELWPITKEESIIDSTPIEKRDVIEKGMKELFSAVTTHHVATGNYTIDATNILSKKDIISKKCSEIYPVRFEPGRPKQL